MFAICAAFIALVIAVVLLTNIDRFRSAPQEESQLGSLPPGQVGYDLQGFMYDETFFDEEPTLPIVELIEGAPSEGTEEYTHVIPDEEEAPEGAGDKGKETELHGKAGSTDL